MNLERKYFAATIAALGLAAIGGWDVFHNVVPERERIIRNIPACSGLDLSYSDLQSRAMDALSAARTLGIEIQDHQLKSIVDCAASASRIVDSSGLNPGGLRQSLDLGALEFGGLGSLALGALTIRLRFGRIKTF